MRSIAEDLSEERRALSRCKRETRERIEALEAEVNESRQEIEKMEKVGLSLTEECEQNEGGSDINEEQNEGARNRNGDKRVLLGGGEKGASGAAAG